VLDYKIPLTLSSLIFVLIANIFIFSGCGEDSDAPEGTLWFCVLKYKITGQPIAAWASKRKPYVYKWTESDKVILDSVIGYDDKGTVIFESRNIRKDKNEKDLEYSVIDVKRIIKEYPKYVRFWKGSILPGCEDIQEKDNSNTKAINSLRAEIKKVHQSKQKMIAYVNNQSKTGELTKLAKTRVVNNIKFVEEKSYTYEIKNMRGNDFKYRYYIIRNDGEKVLDCNTEMEAKRLIPYLK